MSDICFSKINSENPLIIGELACGHNGSVDKFISLVDAVKQCGVSTVKSQVFIPTERATQDHPEWEIFNKLCFTESDWKKIRQYTAQKGVQLFADVFGQNGFNICKKIGVDGYKIHSEDMLNFHFILNVARQNLLTLIGVGGAHRLEIYRLLRFLRANEITDKIVLMPGVQTFPTATDEHNLKEISDLVKKYSDPFGVKVGCADHICGDDEMSKVFPLMALSEGACVLEKHVTIDRANKWEDFESALGIQDFKVFVNFVGKTSPWLKSIQAFSPSEKEYRNRFKKIPVASVSMKKDTILSTDAITYIKDAKLKFPLTTTDLASTKLSQDILAGDYISRDKLQNKVGLVIIARTGSSRLPSKALMPILDKPSILWLIERVQRCKKIDEVILATSDLAEDDQLVEIALKSGINVYRGNALDVSDRLLGCAERFALNHIVRVTGDDLMRDEIVIDKAVQSHLESSCDVTITSWMPYGTQTEIFSYDVIHSIKHNVIQPHISRTYTINGTNIYNATFLFYFKDLIKYLLCNKNITFYIYI